VNTTDVQPPGFFHLLALSLLVAGSQGCIYGSLASDTGPSHEGVWSVAGVQQAHVGETVQFSFIVRQRGEQARLALQGVADYAAMHILEDRFEAEADLIENRFAFSCDLVGVQPERTITVTAEALETRGSRDYMEIRGQWRRSVSSVDDPDRQVVRAVIKLRTYRSRIEQPIEPATTDLDWSTARLLITRLDGEVSTVFEDKPQRPGFTLNGPDDEGRYHLQYFPLAEQINKTGTTQAGLYVLDANGRQHTYKFEFDTP